MKTSFFLKAFHESMLELEAGHQIQSLLPINKTI